MTGSELKIDDELLDAGYRYAISLCANQHDAEDLTHDACINIMISYGEVVDKGLLFSSIRNRFIDQYRRHRNWQAIARDLLVLADRRQADVGPGVDMFQLFDLQPHLAKLRATEREALFLQVVEGYTAIEIARLTQSSRGNVLSLIYRARKKLQKSIEKKERIVFDAMVDGTTTADRSD